MYRKLITLLLCVGTVLAAPQKDSKITYVKRQIDQTEPQPEVKQGSRESRIENLPLTVPGTLKPETKKTDSEQNSDATTVPVYNYSDRIYSIKTKPKKNDNSTKNRLAPLETPEVTTSNIPSPDILPSESIQTDTIANSTVKIYETDDTATDVTVTEKYEEELTITTIVEEETTKAPTPTLLPKLSHYGKSTLNSFSQNLIGSLNKRRFRSKCRCEKIWNCTKLQISVPRCPEEYFLCCS